MLFSVSQNDDDDFDFQKENGGVIMINFYTHFIVCNPSNKTTATVADIAGELCFIQSLRNNN